MVEVAGEGCKMTNFYVYILRRPDKADPFDESKACPFYVGKGRGVRIKEHRWQASSLLKKLGKKCHKIGIIHKLWKHGLDFVEEVYVREITEEQAFEIERYLIGKYGRVHNHTGILVNLTDGGEGTSGWLCKPFSEEHRRKISESSKGKIISEEHRKKISESSKGRIVSEETRSKLSIGKLGEKNPNFGKPCTEKRRQQVSESHRGKKFTEEHKLKIGKALKGRIITPEWRQKLSDAKKGKKGASFPCSEERRKRISDSVKRYYAQKRMDGQ